MESNIDNILEGLKKAEDFNKLNVLDKGYVRLIDTLGSDLSVVNAAKVSFEKASTIVGEKEERLIKFLAENGHTSPFRHVFFTFEIKAPLMVCRQHEKYVVGSDHTMDSFNEASRRYITGNTEFYVPQYWRGIPDNKKQGSKGILSPTLCCSANSALRELQEKCIKLYDEAISSGVCVEQARLFLPAYGLYVLYRWSASLQSVGHFLNQRLADDAQWEIQRYAQAIKELVFPICPISFKYLVKEKENVD